VVSSTSVCHTNIFACRIGLFITEKHQNYYMIYLLTRRKKAKKNKDDWILEYMESLTSNIAIVELSLLTHL